LSLPLRDYYELYRAYGRLGFARYPLYHVYFLVGYILGEKRFDFLTSIVRRQLGRTPRVGHFY